MNILRTGLAGNILDALLIRQPLKLAELLSLLGHTDLGKRSPAGIHKALAGLITDGLVRKNGRLYSIDPLFVEELEKFVRRLSRQEGDKNSSDSEARTQKHTFSTLAEMDKFLNRTIHRWIEDSPGTDHYVQHAPHAWFALAHFEEEETAIARVAAGSLASYTLVNQRTPLDLWMARFYKHGKKGFYQWRKVANKRANDHYYGVFGDWYFECRYPAKVVARLEALYSKTEHIGDLRPFELVQLFSENSHPFVVEIALSSCRAETLRNAVLRYF